MHISLCCSPPHSWKCIIDPKIVFGYNKSGTAVRPKGMNRSWQRPGAPAHLATEGAGSGAVCTWVERFSLLSSMRESRSALVAPRARSNVESLRCSAPSGNPHPGVEHLRLHEPRLVSNDFLAIIFAQKGGLSHKRASVTLVLFSLMGEEVWRLSVFFWSHERSH